jgi:trypsin-like peptidase
MVPIAQPRRVTRGRMSLFVVALLVSGGAVVVASTADRPGPESVSPSVAPHPLEAAHAAALKVLAGSRPLAGAAQLAQDAIVRIRVHRQDGLVRVTTVRATGVLLAGGRLVATSSRVFDVLDTDSRCDVEVVFVDGRTSPASVLRRVSRGDRGEGDDWAVVELDAPRAEIRGLSPKDADPAAGRDGLVLGYPGGLGWDTGGQIRSDATQGQLALRPVIAVVKRGAERWDVTSTSEDFPAGTGSPVLDSDGYIVAIATGSSSVDGQCVVETVPIGPLSRWLAVHPARRR